MSHTYRPRVRPLVLSTIVCVGILVLLGPVSALQRATIARPAGAGYDGRAFTFHEIAENVYHAVVIISDTDVLVVDTHIFPAAGWALLEELKTLTPMPVRYVVNTHFHFDHTHGNQVLPAGVEIIGHEFTRDAIASGASGRGRAYERSIGGLPGRIAAMRERAAGLLEMNELQELEEAIAIQEWHLAATSAVEPVAPTVTIERSMTLHRGGREIPLLHLGRGHTWGDVDVHLPAERIVITGDLMTAGVAYLGDAYPEEWVETLERLEALEFDIVVPGHGRAFGDRERIDSFQAYLRDFWSQVTKLHESGVSAADAARQIDMRSHAVSFPEIEEVGVDPHGVERAYGLIEETER